MHDLKEGDVSAILEHRLVQAKNRVTSGTHVRAKIWSMLQRHADPTCPNVKYAKRDDPPLFYKHDSGKWTIDAELAAEGIPDFDELVSSLNRPANEESRTIRRYEFVTFHQSYTYEDFVEGIRPVLAGTEENDAGSGELEYEIKPGVFRAMAERAALDPDHRYAIFIDEINRGNVSQVFGELITLIEEDKRLGSNTEVVVRLPYSRQEFGVPSNLHIIGTMNTADRSAQALDTALRRRFEFQECVPRPNLLSQDQYAIDEVDIEALLATVNSRIERLLDRNYTIGHAYFMEEAETEPIERLRATFANRVIPLLQEYFYDDWSKIGLVLREAVRQSRTADDRFRAIRFRRLGRFRTEGDLPHNRLRRLDGRSSRSNVSLQAQRCAGW